MKKLIYLIPALFISSFLVSCEEDDLDDLLGGGETGLSDSEIIDGLKTALNTGTDSSASRLSAVDGYLKDEAVKILLPDELSQKINSFKGASKTVDLGLLGSVSLTGADLYDGYQNTLLGIDFAGLKGKEEDLILGLNRAAEFAAQSSAPIFKDAITTMSIEDGLSILNGADTAATGFLRSKTFTPLFNTYEPIVDNALSEVKVGNKSVVAIYEDYVNSYNSIVNTATPAGSVGSLLSLDGVEETDISEYGTDRALTGLFLKVSDEEREIRKNPFAYVSDILQKVFGSLLD